jgi:hypothetical protein
MGNSGSFVGISGNLDIAGGPGSAVLGGLKNEACDGSSAIGGGSGNVIAALRPTTLASFIGAGFTNAVMGANSFLGSGSNNETSGFWAFVGAGAFNLAQGDGSFVGAGGAGWFQRYDESPLGPVGNAAYGTDSFVGAGDLNQISSAGNGSFIGGGGYAWATATSSNNSTAGNEISGVDSFIGAGDNNNVAGSYAAIAGGGYNTATSSYGSVGGGEYNNATGTASVVGGGSSSSARGTYATIPGGYENAADGMGSFAAGSLAKARNTGAFVWSDNASSAAVQSTANYQFVARASGGYFLYSDTMGDGVQLSSGSGTWGSLSDRTMKTNVVPIDDVAVLDKVATLPVSEWSYTAERGVRHVGPMAQDFYAAFGVGVDNRHITSIDEDGVALAAIKALHAENARLRNKFEADNSRLRSRLAVLEAKLDRLASRSDR